MKKPARSKSRSKTTTLGRQPLATATITHAQPGKRPAVNHSASDISPLLALLLCLPAPTAKAASHRQQATRGQTSIAPLSDDASAFLLLSLPILAMIVSIGITQTLKPLRRIELTPTPVSLIVPSPAGSLKVYPPSTSGAALTSATPPALTPASAPSPVSPSQPGFETLNITSAALLGQKLPSLIAPAKPDPLSQPPARLAMLSQPRPAILAPAGAITAPSTTSMPPVLAARNLTAISPSRDAEPGACAAPAHLLARARPFLDYNPTIATLTPAAFGVALAAAAKAQTKDFVIYNDKYRAISYPGGDVPSLYGVCTDVIIRAYRALGIDLQQRVHEARLGSGDSNIDHRRTDVLRRFFARFGEQLRSTTFAEDYLPGDIISYNRPQNRHSRSHIAMVSDVVGASGRYMIVHNRGWGPQLEDALFVDEITGHYRYRATPASPLAAVADLSKNPKDPSTLVTAVSAPQKRPAALARLAAREARVTTVRRRDGASVPGLGR